MKVQVIVYSLDSARVRRVYDAQCVVVDLDEYLKTCTIGPGEGRYVYTKRGEGNDTILEWQAAVSLHTLRRPASLHPQVHEYVQRRAVDTGKTLHVVNDLHRVVDATGNILHVGPYDPACGDSVAGCTLIPHPHLQRVG